MVTIHWRGSASGFFLFTVVIVTEALSTFSSFGGGCKLRMFAVSRSYALKSMELQAQNGAKFDDTCTLPVDEAMNVIKAAASTTGAVLMLRYEAQDFPTQGAAPLTQTNNGCSSACTLL